MKIATVAVSVVAPLAIPFPATAATVDYVVDGDNMTSGQDLRPADRDRHPRTRRVPVHAREERPRPDGQR